MKEIREVLENCGIKVKNVEYREDLSRNNGGEGIIRPKKNVGE